MADELPDYSPRPSRPHSTILRRLTTNSPTTPSNTEHAIKFTLSAQDSVTLKFTSRAQTPNARPVFVEGDSIDGAVLWNLSKPLSLKRVELKLLGYTQMTAYAGMQYDSLQTTGVTSAFCSVPLSLFPTANRPSKLPAGTHSWPFHINIPTTCKAEGDTFPLPPAFDKPGFPRNLAYSLILTIKKKGIFANDEEFIQAIHYQSIIHPKRPSTLRETAYAEGTALLGPDVDEHGWASQTGLIQGRLFDAEDVQLNARLYLAEPLTYAIGSVIPFIVNLSGEASHRVDLLSKTESFGVTLVKTTIIGGDALKETVVAGKKKANVTHNTVGKGVCWIPPSMTPSTDTKLDPTRAKTVTYHGEIRVPADLMIPFAFPGLSVSYSVHIVIEVPGFTPPPNQESGFLIVPVKIASYSPEGPAHRLYAPAPGYRAG